MVSFTPTDGAAGPQQPAGRAGNGSSVGARWTSGLGAFLLVAAAATFTAVRWEEIPDEAKFGALVGCTIACLVADSRLRDRLPITSTALFHIGILLVPIDVAAVGVWRGWLWPDMLLAQGLAIAAACGGALYARRSVVLLWGTWLGVVLVTGGIGATLNAPAGLLLAVTALVATVASVQASTAADAGASTAASPGDHTFWRASRGSADRSNRDLVKRGGVSVGPHHVGAAAVSNTRTGSRWWDLSAGPLMHASAGWAILAGLATPMAAAERAGLPATGVLYDLGVASDAPHPSAAATGTAAAAALFIVATRQRSLPLAFTGVASLVTGLATTWIGLSPGPEAVAVALASTILLLELAAWALGNPADPGSGTGFWATTMASVAGAAEVVAGFASGAAAVFLLTTPFGAPTSRTTGLAAILIALTWVVAALRRPMTNARTVWPWTATPADAIAVAPLAAALTAATGVALITGSRPATACALGALGALTAAVSPTALPGAAINRVLAVSLSTWAPVVAYDEPIAASLLAVAGAGAMGTAAIDTARYSGLRGFNQITHLLGLLSLAPLAAGSVIVAGHDWTVLATGGAVVTLWLLAALLDHAVVTPAPARPRPRPASSWGWTGGWGSPGVAGAGPGAGINVAVSGPVSQPLPLGMIPRLASLVPLGAILAAPDAFTPLEALAVAAVFAVLALVDALRREEPLLLLGAGCAVPIALVSLVLLGDGTYAEAGILVTLSGVVWLGVAGGLPDRWAMPAAGCAGLAATVGLLLGAEESWALDTNLLITGGALAVTGAALQRLEIVAAGGAIATFGLWRLLVAAEVTASEPYLAPIALALLVAGWQARRPSWTSSPASSWLAYVPGVALMGGAAVAERFAAGSSGWHAVLAGAIGVAAVMVGAIWRQAGPLITGTVIVVALTVHETLGVAAAVPTWAWLALGGTALLVTGFVMERRGTGPLDTGRRLVDLVTERFT